MADRHAQINRRSCLKAAAGIASLTAFGIGSAAAAETDYDVIEVSAGETHRVSLSSGDTFENKLIDITASGANYRISASGSGWTIRNVGIRGEYEGSAGDSPFRFHVSSSDGTGLIENVYLGDGDEFSSYPGATGLKVNREHAGTVTINRANIQGFNDNAIYASSPGHDASSAGGGDTIVTNTYSAHNSISGIRLGTDGSYAENCVVYDCVHRGFWGYYENTEAIDCDFLENGSSGGRDIELGTSSRVKSHRSEVTVTNTRFDSSAFQTSTNEINGDSAGTPEHRIPEGVPQSPEEAASGSGYDGSDAGTTDDTDNDELSNTIVVDGTQSAEVSVYELSVSGEIEPAPELTSVVDGGLSWDSVEDDVSDGTVTGVVGNGKDGYRFSGEITNEEIRGDASVSIERNDQ